MFRRLILNRLNRILGITIIISALSFAITPAHAQEPKTKVRIANSAMSVTSLPLLAARDWKLFHERGADDRLAREVAKELGYKVQ